MGNEGIKNAWLHRLKPNQQHNVRRLKSLGSDVTAALYRLTPFVGLWSAFDIGRIPTLQGLHCPEVRPISTSNVGR